MVRKLPMPLLHPGPHGPPYLDDTIRPDRPAAPYQHALAELRALAQATADGQGIPLARLLADVRDWNADTDPPASRSDKTSFRIHNLNDTFPRTSPRTDSFLHPISIHQTLQPEHLSFPQPEATAAWMEGVRTPSSASGWLTPDPGPQADISGDVIWPAMGTASPITPIYSQQLPRGQSPDLNYGTAPMVAASSSQDMLPPRDDPTATFRFYDGTIHAQLGHDLQPPPNSPAPFIGPARAPAASRVMRNGRIQKPRSQAPNTRTLCVQPRQRQPNRRYEDENLQQLTNDTRKRGACVRCKMQRLRCIEDPDDPAGDCLTCKSVTGPIVYKLPCLRYKIRDALLIDHGPAPRTTWTIRWPSMELNDIVDWRSSNTKVISITQDIGNLSISLTVREFIPQAGDDLARRWVSNGQEDAYYCVPYAIENMRETGEQYKTFVEKNLGAFLAHYTAKSETLIASTYKMALHHLHNTPREEEKQLLRDVLRLWMGCRMETRSDRICSDETLGMKPYDGPYVDNYGRVLLPPVLTAQTEIIVTTTILKPAAEAVLQRLQKLVTANKSHSWFAIYLTMFILMHSCSLMTVADIEKARKQGIRSGPYRRALIEELHMGATILLAHFHYCTKGNFSFTRSGQPKLGSFGDITELQARFIHATRQYVINHADQFQALRDAENAEHEMYFLSQLFERDWKPHHARL